MSVVLSGSASADMTSFTGKWHFAKEIQRRDLDFGYKRVASEVPRDLLNFVSFIHPNGAHPSASGTVKRNKSKNKKRRARGRFGSSEAIATAASAEAAPGSLTATASTSTVNNEVKGEEATGAAGEGAVGNENEQDAEDGGEDDDAEDQGEEEEDDEGAPSAAAAEGTEGAATAPGDEEQQQQQQQQQQEETRPTHPAPLRTDHPLFGLWEGTFEIVALTPDAETQVSETFFLHSFFGEGPSPELADLPPEARFSATVLKTSPVQLIPIDDASAGGEEQPIVLVGFGRNKFGRFSLTASFRPSLNTLVIEKKYMLTKYPQNQAGNAAKRRRQSNDQHALDRSGLARSRSFGFGTNPDLLLDDYDDYLPGGAAKRKRGKDGSRKDRLSGRGEGGLDGAEYDENGTELLPLGAYQQYIPNEGDEEDFRAAFYDEQTGEVFEGGWFNGKRHGRGICLYIDGSMYEGNWNYGKEHGHGQLMSGDRQVICVGEWMDGLLHGHGTYNFASGDKYTGEFREGNRHGKGELVING